MNLAAPCRLYLNSLLHYIMKNQKMQIEFCCICIISKNETIQFRRGNMSDFSKSECFKRWIESIHYLVIDFPKYFRNNADVQGESKANQPAK